jgi:hypothetical protein
VGSGSETVRYVLNTGCGLLDTRVRFISGPAL